MIYQMKVYNITILGKVKAKERPRRGRGGHFYTPSATQAYELSVHNSAAQAGLIPLTDDTLNIGICFYGQYGRSDIDNLCKSVLDGFKYFFNDNRITFLVAKKIPSKDYLTKVKIW